MHPAKINLLIADDVENIRSSLSEIINLYSSNVNIVATTDSVTSTVKAIQEHRPDIVLLDVEMGDGTGFDVLKQIEKPWFKVIFITAYREYSLEAFRFSALDYLLKPVDPEELIRAINKAADIIDREKLVVKIDSFLHNLENATKKIVLKTVDSIHVVQLQDIMYCEADQGYTSFYLSDQSRIMVARTLGYYDELFANHNFIRIHQSYLVNINYIQKYDKSGQGNVVLKDKINIPVSSRKKEHLMKLLSSM